MSSTKFEKNIIETKRKIHTTELLTGPLVLMVKKLIYEYRHLDLSPTIRNSLNKKKISYHQIITFCLRLLANSFETVNRFSITQTAGQYPNP